MKGDKTAKAAGKKEAATTLTEDSSSTAAVTTVNVTSTKAMSRWTMTENRAWLDSRGLSTSGKAPELKDRVKQHKDDPIVVVEVAATSQPLVLVVHDVAMVPYIDDSTAVAAIASGVGPCNTIGTVDTTTVSVHDTLAKDVSEIEEGNV